MMPTIEVSGELYRALQGAGAMFEDKSPEDVIWRLIRERQTRDAAQSSGTSTTAPVAASSAESAQESRGLMSAGVLIPGGLNLRFNYKGRLLPGVVRDGRIWIGDRSFTSPSSAGAAAAATLG